MSGSMHIYNMPLNHRLIIGEIRAGPDIFEARGEVTK